MYKKVIVTVTCMKDQMLDHQRVFWLKNHPNFLTLCHHICTFSILILTYLYVFLYVFFFYIIIFILLTNYIVLNISWHVVIGKWVA